MTLRVMFPNGDEQTIANVETFSVVGKVLRIFVTDQIEPVTIRNFDTISGIA